MRKKFAALALALAAPLVFAQGAGTVQCPDKNIQYWQAFPRAASRTCRRATSSS
ncbi:hypothetical protein ACPWT1_06535 [Ramlibacter sp. MMS24-I3-19]|uniref:hypothetical protein n=1 Tax=Ramlibacter sp. MMS24-I3-19 TaxID=3416606 RepID=UPI003CFF56B2